VDASHGTALLPSQFANIVIEYWLERSHRRGPADPRSLLRTVWTMFPQFKRFYEHDAQEFLRTLLDSLSEQSGCDQLYEVAFGRQNPVISKPKPQDSDNDQEKKESSPPPVVKKSPFFDIFGFLMRSDVMCLTCKNTSSVCNPYMDVSLELPSKTQIERATAERKAAPPPKQGWIASVTNFVGLTNPSISLRLCLHSFCTSEELNQTNEYNCEKCKKKRAAKKSLSFVRLPKVLVLHVKRFSHGYWTGSSKVSTKVEYPEVLNMARYLHKSVKDQETIYDLFGMVRHSGGTGGGHYLAYAKHPVNGRWFCFDDDHVQEMEYRKVAQQQAYVLFYLRREKNVSTSLSKISKVIVKSQQQKSKSEEAQWHYALSRYWFVQLRIIGPSAIDNGWFCCPHGVRLPQHHDRFKECVQRRAVFIDEETWNYLHKAFGGGPQIIVKASKEKEAPFSCKRCARDELEKRQRKERQDIEHLCAEKRLLPNDYAISQKWLQGWREFVKGRSTTIPGPITNEDIIGSDGEFAEGLPTNSYTSIDAVIWDYLNKIYGGTPVKFPLKSSNHSVSEDTSSPMCKSDQTDSPPKEVARPSTQQLDSKSQESGVESRGKKTKL